MSDLIDRQAAIEAASYECGELRGVFGRIEERLKALPSAQPELAIKDCRNCKHGNYNDHWDTYFCYHSGDCNDWDKWEPSAQPEGWMERNKDRILQAGKEGREVEFRIGGRLFAIRERAQ